MSDPSKMRRRRHRLPGETSKAHAAFRLYCTLADDRSCAEVGKRLGKSRQLVERWSARHQWTERSRACDSYVDDQQMEALIRERKRMAARQAQAAILGQNLAVRRLMELQDNMVAGVKTPKLTAAEAARLFEFAPALNESAAAIRRRMRSRELWLHIGLRDKPRFADPEEHRRE